MSERGPFSDPVNLHREWNRFTSAGSDTQKLSASTRPFRLRLDFPSVDAITSPRPRAARIYVRERPQREDPREPEWRNTKPLSSLFVRKM